MQALASASNRKRSSSVASQAESASERCAQDLLTNVPVAMWFIRRHMRCNRAKGLSLPQFRVLVRAEEKASLSEVAYFLGTTLPTASRMVSGLVERGLVSRVVSATDRRVSQLSLTPRGQAILEDARVRTRSAVAAELVSLSAAECDQIANALRIIGRVFAASKPD